MDIGSLNTNGIHGSSSSTDEELTSLTWLHDKNLLKGINLTCAATASNTKTMANDSPPIVHQQQPQQHQHTRQSPTSDFLDDSCVSEDNASSAGNSCSDQGISIYSMETSPSISNYQFTTTTMPPTLNNNNNSHNKNRNHFVESPIAGGGTQIVHVGSDGTIFGSKSISGGTVLQMASGAIVSTSRQSPTSSVSSSVSTSSTTTAASTPHQHFHKKYLREEHNKTLKQTTMPISPVLTPLKQEYRYV